MGDPEGVLQRPVRTRDHDRHVVFQAGPVAVDAFDEVYRQKRVRGALHGHAADLTLAHRVMTIAYREQRARHIDPEIDRRACLGLWGVHVAAERLGHQHVAGFACRRRHADRAQERLQRQRDLVV